MTPKCPYCGYEHTGMTSNLTDEERQSGYIYYHCRKCDRKFPDLNS